jgi:DNA-binding transcriptional ArsR family regulator/uncharacterized protein YndB with AHSA1/START domain
MGHADGDLDAVLRALSHPIRREILWLVWERARPVGDIASRFSVAGPTISEHLRVLRRADLVDVVREGTVRRYRAKRDRLGPLSDVVVTDRVARAHRRAAAGGDAAMSSSAPRATVSRPHVLAVEVTLAAPLDEAFAHWTTPELMARWVGDDPTCDPVDGGVFAFTLDWGAVIRGVYEAVVPPRVLVFRWDFDEDQIPIPSADLGPTFVLFTPAGAASQVNVTQVVHSADAASFLATVWPETLERLRTSVTSPSQSPGARRAAATEA